MAEQLPVREPEPVTDAPRHKPVDFATLAHVKAALKRLP